MKKWFLFSLICIFSVIHFSCQSFSELNAPVKLVSAEQARESVLAGKALLVCSYYDGKCSSLLLDGAILKSELEAKAPSLPKDQEIIFY